LAGVERDASAELERSGLVPDYAVVRRADDLGEPSPADGPDNLVALVAARLGTTRLIDNRAVDAA
jgi:pantoate--beta-alanine ligase